MFLRIPLFYIFLFGVIGSLSAQKTISTAPIPFSISYYGDLFVHPGFKISADLKVYEFSKSKTKRSGKVKAITKSLIATPNLSNYWHVRSHTGLQAGIDILWRKSNGKGWYSEMGFGMGYFSRNNWGDTWEVKEGETKNLNAARRGYSVQTVSFSKGKEITLERGLTLSPFVRWNTNFLNNYNSFSIPTASFELGVRFIPAFSPKIKYRLINKQSLSKNE